MRVSVESLRHHLDVFLWEHPEWAGCEVVMENEMGGRIYARRPVREKGKLVMTWEEETIYECATRRSEDSI